MPTFRCPSDPGKETFSTAGVVVELATSQYAGSFGSTDLDDESDNGDGVFYRNSKVRQRDITDGLSNTLAVGERSTLPAAEPRTMRENTTWVGVVPGATNGPALVLGDASHVPNDAARHAEGFSSLHTQLTNFLLCDGSVRSIYNTIDPEVFAALATRTGGEVVPGD